MVMPKRKIKKIHPLLPLHQHQLQQKTKLKTLPLKKQNKQKQMLKPLRKSLKKSKLKMKRNGKTRDGRSPGQMVFVTPKTERDLTMMTKQKLQVSTIVPNG